MASAESISPHVQDYAKAVYALESRAGAAVSTTDLAERLGVTAGSVSAMVRKLSEVGLLEHEPYHGVRLTELGRRVALEVLRHHRLIELFLADELGMPWDRVHAEAEVLEHVLSDELEQLIATRLGNPTTDPHGDPIPTTALQIDEPHTRSLDELGPGAAGRSRHRAGRSPGGRRPSTIRRPRVRPLPRGNPAPGRRSRASHAHRARAGGAMTLRRRSGVPALEAASAGESAVLADAAVGVPSALEQLLARGRLRATLAMLGPAFVAAIAYVDPGNFATNVQGGARYGYLLLWVVLLANLMAMLIQYLSAKLGIITDRNLPEVVRERFPRAVTWSMWIQAEIMAMSTDIAEFLGAALGLNLLFGVPLLPAGLMAAAIAFAILALQSRGYRRFELAISALLGLILLGFLYETLRIGPSAHDSLRGLLPGLHGASSLYLAVGIIGATVMPHVVYLHSALTNGRMPCRNDRERGRVLRFERLDVIVALGLAGVVNMAMLAMAAKLFHTHALADLSGIGQAHAELGRLLGGGAALAFAVALLASGISSSSVGTYAGQVVMAGFINLRIPLLVRRAITMLPAIAVLAAGLNPTSALVLSQVVLSFGIPLALVPLVMLTGRRSVMGVHVNRPLTTIVAWGIAILISALNMFLLYQQLFSG
jgi:manganese transport protein